DPHDVVAAEAPLVEPRRRDPDRAVFVANREVPARGGRHPVAVDPLHRPHDRVARVRQVVPGGHGVASSQGLGQVTGGMSAGNANANSITINPTTQTRARLWPSTARKMADSRPSCCVAVLAMTIDCASIIFPITPPAEFAAAIRTGFSPSRSAVTFWRLPNSAFEPASVPVRATPSQPSSVPKNGNRGPARAKLSQTT